MPNLVCTAAFVFEHFVQSNAHKEPLPSQLAGGMHTGVETESVNHKAICDIVFTYEAVTKERWRFKERRAARG